MKWIQERFRRPHVTHVWGERRSNYPILAIPVVLVWLVTTWFAFDYGRGRAGYDSGEAAVRVGELRDEIRVLDKEREQLKRRIAALERQDQVAQEAQLQMKSTLIRHQDEKLKLEKEVLFLRGVISGQPGKAQLRIQNFKTMVDSATGFHRLQFTIDQSMAGKRRVEGDAKITLTGADKNGKEVTLPLGDIAKDDAPMQMGFLHFQKIDQFFKLPDGFKPSYWKVQLDPSEEEVDGLSERFEWKIVD